MPDPLVNATVVNNVSEYSRLVERPTYEFTLVPRAHWQHDTFGGFARELVLWWRRTHKQHMQFPFSIDQYVDFFDAFSFQHAFRARIYRVMQERASDATGTCIVNVVAYATPRTKARAEQGTRGAL